MVDPNSRLAEFDNQLVGEMRQERTPEPEQDHFFKWLGRTDLAQATKDKIVDLLSQERQLESDVAKGGANLYADILNLVKIDKGDWSGRTIEEIQDLEEGEKSLKALLWPAALAVKGGQKVTDFLFPDSSVEWAEKAGRGEPFTKGEALMGGLPLLEFTGAGLAAPFIKKGGSAVIKAATKVDDIPKIKPKRKNTGTARELRYATIKDKNKTIAELRNNEEFSQVVQDANNYTNLPKNSDARKMVQEKILQVLQSGDKNKIGLLYNDVDSYALQQILTPLKKSGALEKGTDYNKMFRTEFSAPKLVLEDHITRAGDVFYEYMKANPITKWGHKNQGQEITFRELLEIFKKDPELEKLIGDPFDIPAGKYEGPGKLQDLTNEERWLTHTKGRLDSVLHGLADEFEKFPLMKPHAIRETIEMKQIPKMIGEIFSPDQRVVYNQQKKKIREKLEQISLQQEFPVDLSKVNNYVNAQIKRIVKEQGATPENAFNQLKNVDTDKLANLLFKRERLNAERQHYNELLKDTQKLYGDTDSLPLDVIELGHIKAVEDSIDNVLDADNLFLQTKKANRREQDIRKRVKNKIALFKDVKTGNERKKILDDLLQIYDDLAGEGTITNIEGAVMGKAFDEKQLEIGESFFDETRFKQGGMVQSMKDGGIIRYFQDGTGEEGVTADQGPISGFDVKPFIPPGARIDEDPLTLGDIGRGASEVAETAWPYLVPGVGEHLSAKDYRHFSSEAEKALAEGDYPKYAGMLALGTVALGGTYPNWTVVGAVPNIVLGAYKGVKKAITKPKKIAPPVPKEERFVIKDSQNKTVDWKKTKEEADEAVSKLSAAEGTEFSIIKTEVPIHMPAKIKKKKPEKKSIDVTPEMVIGTGDNRTYYSKLDEILTNPTGNMRVKTGDSGNVIDIPINEVSLTAKEWHNTLRMAGIKESELTDSYIRQYLNKMGAWDQAADGGRGAFTSNAKISYQEIKALADESPSRFLQTSTYSTRDGNLKYGDTGRSEGNKAGSNEEHILWIDSKNIKGDTGKISDDLRGQTQSHPKMKEVDTDVNFAAKNKLEGEPYIIGWSLVDERPGKLAGGKSINVSTASEIQSDFLQILQKKKTKLKKQINELQSELNMEGVTPYQARVTERNIKETQEELANLIRPLGLSDNEINKIITSLTKNQQIFHKASKLSLDDMSPAVFKELDLAAKERDTILTKLHQNIDQMTLQQAFPNVPFKDQKEWVDALIKNDIAIAAKKRFYFDENGVLQINKNAPSHYTVSPSKVVKKRWSVPDDQYGMHVAPNMRTTEQHGKGVAYDLQYGGPKVVDHNGNAFRGNAEESLRRIAANKNAEFSIGKVNFGGTFEDSFLIELTPEMLTPYIQYFKYGGLVEAIPYNPLRSVLDILGPIGAY